MSHDNLAAATSADPFCDRCQRVIGQDCICNGNGIPDAIEAQQLADHLDEAAEYVLAEGVDGVDIAKVARSFDVPAQRLAALVEERQRFAEMCRRQVAQLTSVYKLADDDVVPRTWQPVDLGPVLDGTYRPPVPTVGRRDDDVGLFYPARVHSVASESEGGKTWFALHAAAAELDRGNSVLYLDFEDDEGGIVGRLLALGTGPDTIRQRFGYIRPAQSIKAQVNDQDLADAFARYMPTLVVIDGVTEAMALHGLELKDNTDVAKFGKLLPNGFAAAGAAVVMLDHVVKDREGRGRYALGGAHKLNGLNGAAYVLENRTPFGVGITGKSTVYIAKDRPAQLRKHALRARDGLHWFADLELASVTYNGETLLSASLSVPEHRDEPFRPTVLMKRVSDALSKAAVPLNTRGILDRVKAKQQDVRAAIAVLIDEGHVTVQPGPNRSQLHTVVKPFDGKETT